MGALSYLEPPLPTQQVGLVSSRIPLLELGQAGEGRLPRVS